MREASHPSRDGLSRGQGRAAPSAPRTAAERAATLSTADSARRERCSAPWTAAVIGAPRLPADLPAAPLRSGAALAWLGPPLRCAPPLQCCSGPEEQASRTEISLQRDPAPDIRLASGRDAGGVDLPSGWWGWMGGGRPSTTPGFNLCCLPGCLPNYIQRNLSV